MTAEPPLVVLVGGAPGVGKSTVGKGIAEAMGATSLSGDDLHAAAKTLTTRESHRSLHPGPSGHHRYFTESAPEALVSDAEELERVMWPAVESVVRLHVFRSSPVVIDWWLLPPDEVASIGSSEVASIWLDLEQDALEARERSDPSWVEGSTDPERMMTNFLARSNWRNDLVRDRAQALGLPLVRLDGAEPVATVVRTCLGVLGLDGSTRS